MIRMETDSVSESLAFLNYLKQVSVPKKQLTLMSYFSTRYSWCWKRMEKITWSDSMRNEYNAYNRRE